jgi:hypothetical protein
MVGGVFSALDVISALLVAQPARVIAIKTTTQKSLFLIFPPANPNFGKNFHPYSPFTGNEL